MHIMGYDSCGTNSDLSLKPMTRSGDGVRYYLYILCYVNDNVHDNAEKVLQRLHTYFLFKSGFSNKMYLGT